MKKIILFLLAVTLLGCVQQKPMLEISQLSYSPQEAYAGGVLEATVKIRASSDVRDLLIEAYLNNLPTESKLINLTGNIEKTVDFEIIPYNAGENTIKIKIDPGNIIFGSDIEKERSMSISIKPAVKPDIFSKIPDQNLTSAGLLEFNENGINAIYTASQNPALSNTYMRIVAKAYSKTLREMAIGYFAYGDGTWGFITFLEGISTKHGVEIAQDIFDFGGEPVVDKKIINGNEVFVLNAKPSIQFEFGSVCIWDEKGYVAALVYVPKINAKKLCSDILEKTYNSTNASMLINKVDEIKEKLNISEALLAEGFLYSMNNETILNYTVSYYDDMGVYLMYIDKKPYIQQEHICGGEIIRRADKSGCAESISDDILLAQRKVGDYEIFIFAVPDNKTFAKYTLNKSIETALSLNFSGTERDWVYESSLKKSDCSFSGNLNCTSFSFSNSTLKIEVKNLMKDEIRINGIRCTSEELSLTKVTLPEPVTIKQNATQKFEIRCYDAFGIMRIGDYVYLDTKMYVNLTNLANNETILIEGNVTINET